MAQSSGTADLSTCRRASKRPYGAADCPAFRGELMVAAAGLEPARGSLPKGFYVPLRLSPPRSRGAWPGSWSGLSLHPIAGTTPGDVGGRLPVSTPSPPAAAGGAWLGIGSEAFPEFDAFVTRRFPAGRPALESFVSTGSTKRPHRVAGRPSAATMQTPPQRPAAGTSERKVRVSRPSGTVSLAADRPRSRTP